MRRPPPATASPPSSYEPAATGDWQPSAQRVTLNGCLLEILFFVAPRILCVVAAGSFLWAYGSLFSFLCWAALTAAAGYYALRWLRRTGRFLIGLAGGAMLLWPVDALFHYPFLRLLYNAPPLFGTILTPYPSPSGHCVAYMRRYDGMDTTWHTVMFSHYLGFPSNEQYVPTHRNHEDHSGFDSAWWTNDGVFHVQISDRGRSNTESGYTYAYYITLEYDENSRVVTKNEAQPPPKAANP